MNPKELPQPLVKGVVAAVLIGAGTVYFGRDAVYFPNGSGGDQWKIGRAQVHVFNAHGRRSAEEISAKALDLVNRDRALNGLDPLQVDPRLAEVAQAHAVDMLEHGYFGTVSPQGEALGDRLRTAGETAWVGKNLLVGEAWGDALAYQHVERLERQGMYHRGHRENLLNPDHTHVGFGIVADPATGDVYAVQLFRGGMPGAIAARAAQETTRDGSPKVLQVQPQVTASETQPATAQSPAPDPFREAVNAATAAANLTQTAQTSQEWAMVAGHWQRAIANMKAVPADHPRHSLAQQKAQEYGSNFTYAQTNAGGTVAQSVQPPTPGKGDAAGSTTSTVETSSPTLVASVPASVSGGAIAPVQTLPQSAWLKIILTLLGGGALAFVLSAGSMGLSKSDAKEMPPPPPKLKQNMPWGVIFANAVHDLWEMQPFFKSERVYKMTAATSAHKLQRKLYRRLLSLTDDQAMAMQLIKENLRRHPRQSVNWCCEQAIKDLEKQRQRESSMQQGNHKFGDITLPGMPDPETPDLGDSGPNA